MTRHDNEHDATKPGNPGKHFFHKMIHAVNTIFNSQGRSHQLNYTEVEQMVGMSGVVETNNHHDTVPRIASTVNHTLDAINATANTHIVHDIQSISLEKHPADHQLTTHTAHIHHIPLSTHAPHTTPHISHTPHTSHSSHASHAHHEAHHE